MIIHLMNVMNSINNFFVKTIELGEYEIKNGVIQTQNKYLIGQYMLIRGSILNDTVFLVSDDLVTIPGGKDEAFTGAVCGLAIPAEFLELVGEIEHFQTQVAKNPNIGVVSESFQNYSYSMATNANGMPVTWLETFSSRLNKYRKMYQEVIL